SQCLNNLKQIGLGLHNHLEAKGAFPMGAGHGGASWPIHILPYIDQEGVYNQLNLSASFTTNGATVNSAVLNNFIFDVYKCPSSPLPDLVGSSGWTSQIPSYAGIAGAVPDPVVPARTGVVAETTAANGKGLY